MSGNRPEHIAPPEVVRLELPSALQNRADPCKRQFYNATEAHKYSNNSRIQNIQAEMTYRCLELLDLCVSPLAVDRDEADIPHCTTDHHQTRTRTLPGRHTCLISELDPAFRARS